MPEFPINTELEGVPSSELILACESLDATWTYKFSAYRELMKRERFSDPTVSFVSYALQVENVIVRQKAYLFGLQDICTLYNLCPDEEVSNTLKRLAQWIPAASSETDIRLFEASWFLRFLIGDADVSSVAKSVGPPLGLSLEVFSNRFKNGRPIFPLTLLRFPLFVVSGSPIRRG